MIRAFKMPRIDAHGLGSICRIMEFFQSQIACVRFRDINNNIFATKLYTDLFRQDILQTKFFSCLKQFIPPMMLIWNDQSWDVLLNILYNCEIYTRGNQI